MVDPCHLRDPAAAISKPTTLGLRLERPRPMVSYSLVSVGISTLSPSQRPHIKNTNVESILVSNVPDRFGEVHQVALNSSDYCPIHT